MMHIEKKMQPQSFAGMTDAYDRERWFPEVLIATCATSIGFRKLSIYEPVKPKCVQCAVGLVGDEEEGEIISDDENNGPQEKAKEEKKSTDDKKSSEPRPMSIGDIAARIQEQNALRMASSLDRMHDDDRSRKRHHKKDKRRRRNSHSEEDSPHRKHRRHERQRSRTRSKSRSRSPPKKPKKEIDRVPCKYYMEGKCQKSDECPFSHAIEQTKRTDLCRFYVSGHCIKRNCPFMHEDFPCKFYHTGAPCFADKSCRYSHAPLTDEMREVLMRYLDECKGLKREDLERLSRKAKEREDRHKDPKVARSHKEPLLELPPTLRTEGMHLGAEDTDFRILPPGTGDVDYRVPAGNEDSAPMQVFYRDTMESPTVSPNSRMDDNDRSPGRGGRVTESSDARRTDDGERHNQSPKRIIERPTDPRDRSNNVDSMPGIPKSQRDLLMRLQQRVETSQDSQGSSQEDGRRTPMPDEDTGEIRHDGEEDSDDDQPLTDVLKRLQQAPSNDAPPAAARSSGGIDLVKMISSINSSTSSSSNNNSTQSQNVIGQSNDYWKQLLSIAGVDPATGTSLPNSNQTTPPKVDPRKARDPRQQAQSLSGQAAAPLPVFPTLEVTATIESHDGDAPYVLRPIETSPVRYDEMVHLVKMNFRLKSDPRLERHLEKLTKREEVVAESPQSPPHHPPTNFLAQLGANAGLLSAAVVPVPDRSKIDPRLRIGPLASDPRAPAHPIPDLQALAMGDLRRPPMMPPMSPVTLAGPVPRQDPRQAARDPRQESRAQQNFPQRNDATVNSAEPRPNTRVDPRRRPDPRAKATPNDDPPTQDDQAKKPTPMMYSSPLSAYDDQPPKETPSYPRRNIGRIRKKNQQAIGNSGPQSALPSDETHKSETPSSSSAPTPSSTATASPGPGSTGSVGFNSLPPMPSLQTHPVDSYTVDVEDKTLSEMFKSKDPTASPFN